MPQESATLSKEPSPAIRSRRRNPCRRIGSEPNRVARRRPQEIEPARPRPEIVVGSSWTISNIQRRVAQAIVVAGLSCRDGPESSSTSAAVKPSDMPSFRTARRASRTPMPLNGRGGLAFDSTIARPPFGRPLRPAGENCGEGLRRSATPNRNAKRGVCSERASIANRPPPGPAR